jgi:hypothetical protein
MANKLLAIFFLLLHPAFIIFAIFGGLLALKKCKIGMVTCPSGCMGRFG